MTSLVSETKTSSAVQSEKQMCWRFVNNDRTKNRILHLRLNSNDSFRPYTAFKHLAQPDLDIPKASKGWTTYQFLRKAGWELIPDDPQS